MQVQTSTSIVASQYKHRLLRGDGSEVASTTTTSANHTFTLSDAQYDEVVKLRIEDPSNPSNNHSETTYSTVEKGLLRKAYRMWGVPYNHDVEEMRGFGKFCYDKGFNAMTITFNCHHWWGYDQPTSWNTWSRTTQAQGKDRSISALLTAFYSWFEENSIPMEKRPHVRLWIDPRPQFGQLRANINQFPSGPQPEDCQRTPFTALEWSGDGAIGGKEYLPAPVMNIQKDGNGRVTSWEVNPYMPMCMSHSAPRWKSHLNECMARVVKEAIPWINTGQVFCISVIDDIAAEMGYSSSYDNYMWIFEGNHYSTVRDSFRTMGHPTLDFSDGMIQRFREEVRRKFGNNLTALRNHLGNQSVTFETLSPDPGARGHGGHQHGGKLGQLWYAYKHYALERQHYDAYKYAVESNLSNGLQRKRLFCMDSGNYIDGIGGRATYGMHRFLQNPYVIAVKHNTGGSYTKRRHHDMIASLGNQYGCIVFSEFDGSWMFHNGSYDRNNPNANVKSVQEMTYDIREMFSRGISLSIGAFDDPKTNPQYNGNTFYTYGPDWDTWPVWNFIDVLLPYIEQNYPGTWGCNLPAGVQPKKTRYFGPAPGLNYNLKSVLETTAWSYHSAHQNIYADNSRNWAGNPWRQINVEVTDDLFDQTREGYRFWLPPYLEDQLTS